MWPVADTANPDKVASWREATRADLDPYLRYYWDTSNTTHASLNAQRLRRISKAQEEQMKDKGRPRPEDHCSGRRVQGYAPGPFKEAPKQYGDPLFNVARKLVGSNKWAELAAGDRLTNLLSDFNAHDPH